jgi:pyruvate/2-oxoglutarate/acetoin dehydrogenase E1 component
MSNIGVRGEDKPVTEKNFSIPWHKFKFEQQGTDISIIGIENKEK